MTSRARLHTIAGALLGASCVLPLDVGAAAAQGPIRKLIDKMPSLLGAPKQPVVPMPSTPIITGLTQPAATTVAGEASTFDLGGFRLGMSEAQIQQVLQARGYRTSRVMRVVDFEGQVRTAVNTRGGHGGLPSRGSVLGEASLKDGVGGTYTLKTIVWPDGAHLSSISYLPPPGTSIEEWRRILVGKWGNPSKEEARDTLNAEWAGRPSAGRAVAQVGPSGGSVYIDSPEGSRSRAGALVDTAADSFFASSARKPSL